MAGRVISRRALRDEHAQVEQQQAEGGEPTPAPKAAVRKPRVKKPTDPAAPKPPAKPRVRRKAAKVAPRMFARWVVCDGGLKHVAVFEYKDRAGADDKLAEMLLRKPGAYVLQLVKVAHDAPPAAEPVAAV